MPIVKQKEVSITGTQNPELVIQSVGHCIHEQILSHRECQSINGILIVSPKSAEDLAALNEGIDRKKWIAPTLWEHALCTEKLKEMIGERLSDALIISKHPFPGEPENEDTTVSVLFHHHGKILLETVPIAVVPKLSRPRFFIYVSHP